MNYSADSFPGLGGLNNALLMRSMHCFAARAVESRSPLKESATFRIRSNISTIRLERMFHKSDRKSRRATARVTPAMSENGMKNGHGGSLSDK